MHAQEASRESGEIGLLSHQHKNKAKIEDEMMLLKNRKVGTPEIEAQRVRYVRRSRACPGSVVIKAGVSLLQSSEPPP
jgi:hypothetical protein